MVVLTTEDDYTFIKGTLYLIIACCEYYWSSSSLSQKNLKESVQIGSDTIVQVAGVTFFKHHLLCKNSIPQRVLNFNLSCHCSSHAVAATLLRGFITPALELSLQ